MKRHIFIKRWAAMFSLCTAFLVLIFLLSAFAPTSPQNTPTLFLLPQSIAPGGDLYLGGYNFPSNNLELWLSGEIGDIPLNDLIPNGMGVVRQAVNIPTDVPAGEYSLFVGASEILAQRPVTILPAPSISFTPDEGPPGTVVEFEVTNLMTGTLQINYEGAPVVGPMPVAGGSYSGQFVVPHDRPEVFETFVPLHVINAVDGRPLGQSTDYFFASVPTSTPPYIFTDVEFSSTNLEPGEFFNITGQIASSGAGREALNFTAEQLSQMNIYVLWDTAGQPTFPINTTQPQINQDGSFSVEAAAPSIINGDMVSPVATGQIGLVLDMKDQQVFSNATPALSIYKPPPLIVKVIDKNTGDPISKAAVIINEGKFGGQVSVNNKSNQNAGKPYTGGYNLSEIDTFNSQISPNANELLPVDDPFNCQKTASYGRTDSQGEFELLFDLENYILTDGNGQEMSLVALGTAGKDVSNYTPPTEVEFDLVVNAIYQGYVYDKKNGKGEFRLPIRYDNITNQFYDTEKNQLLNTNPLVVEMELNDGSVPNLPIKLNVPGAEILASNGVLTEYGTFISFADKNAFPDSMIGINRELRIEFAYNATEYGTLQQNGVNLFFNNKTYPFSFKPTHDVSLCAGSGQYYIDIPDTHRLSAGQHLGRVDVVGSTGDVTPIPFIFTFVDPPKWIRDPELVNRHALIGWYNPGSYFVHLSADVVPDNDPSSSSQLGANVPKVGQLDNEAGANGRVLQSITAASFGQVNYEGAMESMALNKEEDVGVAKTIDGAKPILIGPDVIPILQTGKMPLYRQVIGVPPIAGATLGADIWFSAKLTYEGRIVVNPTGKNSAAIKVTPEATVGVDVWLKGEVLFGIVDVGAKAESDITVKIPFCFINGTKYDGGSSFIYRLYINWWAEAGIWPFRKSITGREKIFDGQKALTSGKCPAPYADAYLTKHIYEYEEDEPPTSAYPAMSTDTLGHTLTVWNSAESNIFSSSYNGIGWTTPLQVTSNNASSSPQVAFMSPNRAVAVWAESSLTPQLAETADLTETIKAQHLMYALWNGTSWSTPQNLTAPTTGDGGVALASCLNLDENCPAGGAVTAVWVHDEVGDPTAQTYHLYYATYQGGSWSTPQLVDPNSRGSETQPTVVYQFGSPVVGWIRDADQSLSTVEDRYFLLRNLSGPYTYFHTSLPTPIEEPSLAVDIEGNLRLAYTFVTDFEAHWGNQRQIGSAAQDCPDIGCEWSFQLYQDDYGRPIHGEAPIITLDSNGVGIISYRALGFGQDENGEVVALDHDPVGVTVGTGEVAQIKTSFTTDVINPVYLSEDGQVNWQVAAVFDPLLKTTHVAAVQGLVPEIVAPDAAQDIRFADPAAEEGLYFANQQQFPDFAVMAIEPETFFPDAESLFDVTVTLLNSGVNWSGEEEGIEMALIASWDGPAGVGDTAGSAVVSQLLTGEPATVVVSVTSPPNPDVQHELYITVNPLLTAAEQNVSNNSMVLTMAGMPTPQNLTGMTKQGSSLVYLTWDIVDDHRVSGYRIYREINGDYVPIGASPTNGFLNFTALFNDPQTYAVTTFTDSGAESPLSETITVTPQPVGIWLPFIAN